MTFVVRSVVYLLLLLLFWFGIGRAFSRWLINIRKKNIETCLLNGFAVATLAATTGYRWGIPWNILFCVLTIISVVGFLLQWLEKPASENNSRCHSRKKVLIAGGILLLLPVAVGGLQFSLIRSNQYDAFNYLQSALVRLTFTSQQITDAGPVEFRENPLLVIGHWTANKRPAIVDSFALTDGLSPGNLYLLSPTFLISVLLLAISPLAQLAEQLGTSRFLGDLIGLAIIGGFWGQYVLDCDTWSLIGALPLALGVFTALNVPFTGVADDRPPPLGIAVLVATLLLIYPEQFCFLAPALGSVLVIRLRWIKSSTIVSVCLKTLVITIVLIAPCSGSLWAFIQGQLGSAIQADHSTLTWATSAFVGETPQTAPRWATGLRLFASLFGTYLPWVDHGTKIGLPLIITGSLGIMIAGAAVYSVRRSACSPSPSRRLSISLNVFTSILIVQTLLVALLMGLWPASKALGYSFPWVMLFAFHPFAKSNEKSFSQLPAAILLGLQFILIIYRPIIASQNNGVGYPAPYPAPDPALKNYRRWNVNDAPHLLRKSHRVLIDVPDVWLEYYAMICMQAEKRAFVTTGPIREYYDMTPKRLGGQNTAVETDGLIFVEYDRRASSFALGFSKGAEVRWTGARPFTITRIVGPEYLESWTGMLSWWGSSEIEVMADETSPAIMEFLIRRRPDLAETIRPSIVVTLNGQVVRNLVIGHLESNTLQGSAIPLNLKKGSNIIAIKTYAGIDSHAIGFSNPRVSPTLRPISSPLSN